MAVGKENWDAVDYSIPMGDPNETEKQIATRLTKTFRVLDRVVDGTIHGNIRSMLVSGAPGCGKSYTVESALKKAEGTKYKIVGGSKSAVDLYKLLYNNRQAGNIIVADDCDNIYYDATCLNLLKHALDTRKQRVLQWNEQSWALLKKPEDENSDESVYPSEFIYEGSAIFCTNLDLYAEVQKGKRLSRHQTALIDRGTYLDLGIHTKREILVRLWQVMTHESKAFMLENNISLVNARIILQWIRDNLVHIQRPSIRLAIKLNGMIESDPINWQETAEVTQFRR